MEKLTIKELAPYLPYGLKGMFELEDVVSTSRNETRTKYLTTDNCTFFLNYCKPILRPLSDLTKEIEVNGEKFVPLEKLVWIKNPVMKDFEFKFNSAKNCHSIRYNYQTERNSIHDSLYVYFTKFEDSSCFSIGNTEYWIIQKLFEWHFDVFGGIGTWAIDKNTL